MEPGVRRTNGADRCQRMWQQEEGIFSIMFPTDLVLVDVGFAERSAGWHAEMFLPYCACLLPPPGSASIMHGWLCLGFGQ